MAERCKLLKMKKTRTTPYNPKSDGLVERFNRTVKQMLTMLVADAENDWDDHLPYVMMAYRASVHESTKCTPNLLMLNREVNLPIDLMVGSPSEGEGPVCPVEYVEWVRLATEEAFEFVRKNLRLSALRQKQYYDQGCGEPQFHPGQSVWRGEEVTNERGDEDKGNTSDSLDTLGDNALGDLFGNDVEDPGGTPSIADESRCSIEDGTPGVDFGGGVDASNSSLKGIHHLKKQIWTWRPPRQKVQLQ